MKDQGEAPLPRQPPPEGAGWWGVGTADGLGKRRGGGSEEHAPSKLQKVVGPVPEGTSCPVIPHVGKASHDAHHMQGMSGENGDDPEPSGCSVPHKANGLLSSNGSKPGHATFHNLIPSCSEPSGSGTNTGPCEVYMPASPACSSLLMHNNLERYDEDRGGSEVKICRDYDRLHQNSSGVVPEATVVGEVCCEMRGKLEGAIKENVCRSEYLMPLNPELQMLNSVRCESVGETHTNEEFRSESVHGVNGNETLPVPKETRQCSFNVGMAPEDHYGKEMDSCAVDGDTDDAPSELPSGNENPVDDAILKQQIDLMQDIFAPGMSRQTAVLSNEEDDGQSVDSCNSDVPDDEIEAMLEEGLLRKPENRCETLVQFNQREKIVLDELGHDHFDVLPEGWVKVTHNSGMPVYLHKASRVCNVTKPYFLGPGSARKHEIPLSAIPCLQYRRALDEEQATLKSATVTVGPGGIQLPNACIETAEENKARHSLSAEQVHEYCEKRFTTKMIPVTRTTKRHSSKTRTRDRKQISRPTLPEGTKLIKFPVENKRPVLSNTRKRKEWILNPNGKSYVCILHEYVQHALKKQPTYIFKETEQPGRPYSASVMIDQVQYGVGCGSSKKHAKSEAAKQTLEILIPEMREKVEEDRRAGHCKASASCNTDLSIFDEIRIEDPRVAELCAKTTEPSPYAILLTCLQRNFGLGELDISCEVRAVRHLNIEYVMTVGKHTAVVMCKNKRDGKQRTSQAVLQKLHPHIKSWGSILRMYGSSSIKSMKDKKQEEQEITFLQSKAEENEPNYAILCKLEDTMLKLATEYKSIGKFVPPSDEKLPSSSGADLNTVNM